MKTISFLLFSFMLLFSLSAQNEQGQAKGKGHNKAKQELKGQERALEAKNKEVRGDGNTAAKAKRQNTLEHKGNNGHSAGNGKSEEHRNDNTTESPKNASNEKHSNQKKANNEPKSEGHAYGKNKEGLEGKEFGQARATEARTRNTELKEQVNEDIKTGENRSSDAKSRIDRARQVFEKAKKSGDLSEDDISKREAALQRAEDKLKILESSLQNAEKQDSPK